MTHDPRKTFRRRLVWANLVAILAAVLAVLPGPAAHAQQCRPTPRDALGPFYKPGAPADANLCASGSGGADRLVVTGRVLGADCKPLAGALVEIWQADARGEYTQVTRGRTDDPGCLLRAALRTDADGRYRYLTIVPSEYPGRPRHIHYRVSHPEHATLVTQLYFGRERGINEALVVELSRGKDGTASAAFDITLPAAQQRSGLTSFTIGPLHYERP